MLPAMAAKPSPSLMTSHRIQSELSPFPSQPRARSSPQALTPFLALPRLPAALGCPRAREPDGSSHPTGVGTPEQAPAVSSAPDCVSPPQSKVLRLPHSRIPDCENSQKLPHTASWSSLSPVVERMQDPTNPTV